MLIDFRFDEEMPDWFYNRRSNLSMDLDVRLTTGKDVEFYCMKGDVHGEGQFDNEAVLDIVEEFVRRHLG